MADNECRDDHADTETYSENKGRKHTGMTKRKAELCIFLLAVVLAPSLFAIGGLILAGHRTLPGSELVASGVVALILAAHVGYRHVYLVKRVLRPYGTTGSRS